MFYVFIEKERLHIKIITDRLIIQPISLLDLESFYEMCSDPEVMQFINNGQILSVEECENYIKRQIDSQTLNGYSRYGVYLLDDKFIGFCGFGTYLNSFDFGYRYLRKYWGKGYASEAAIAVFNYAINYIKIFPIYGVAYKDNIHSVKILKKVGMQFYENIQLNGKIAERYVYNLTKTDF